MWTKNKEFIKAVGSLHEFKSDALVDKVSIETDGFGCLQQQLTDIMLVATANKEHTQQMSTATNDLLTLVKQQQQQIMALTKQNDDLIAVAVLAKFNATKATIGTDSEATADIESLGKTKSDAAGHASVGLKDHGEGGIKGNAATL